MVYNDRVIEIQKSATFETWFTGLKAGDQTPQGMETVTYGN